MSLCRICLFSLLTVSTAAVADAVDINLRDNSAQLQYFASMGRDTLGKAEMHAGILYVDKRNLLADLGLMVKDEIGMNAPGFSVGVGVKGLTAKAQNNNAAALALGGMVRYAPFPDRRLGLITSLYYSPSIVTFGDTDRYAEFGARAEFEIIPQAVVYLGYRWIKFGLEAKSDVILEEGAHLGVRIIF